VTSVLLRHAAAGDREHWEGDDFHRPLDAKGRRQAAELVELLRPLGVRRVVSSPYVRCMETVRPLAVALGVELEADDRLAEGAGPGADELLREDGVVCCTHGDIAEAVTGRSLKKGASVVFSDGRIVRELPPPR
jgi:8-oxo-dGTP diphosphatase